MSIRKLMNQPDAGARPLSEIDSRCERLPSWRVELTAAERKLLRDTNWIDEDEADMILAMREEKKSNSQDWVSLDEYVRRHGRLVRDGRVVKRRRG